MATLASYKSLATQHHTTARFYEVGLVLPKAEPYFGATPDDLVGCDCCGKGIHKVRVHCTRKEPLRSCDANQKPCRGSGWQSCVKRRCSTFFTKFKDRCLHAMFNTQILSSGKIRNQHIKGMPQQRLSRKCTGEGNNISLQHGLVGASRPLVHPEITEPAEASQQDWKSETYRPNYSGTTAKSVFTIYWPGATFACIRQACSSCKEWSQHVTWK